MRLAIGRGRRTACRERSSCVRHRRGLIVGYVGEEEHAGAMALRPEEIFVIAATGLVNSLIWKLFSQPFLQKHLRWAAVGNWPGRQLDRFGEWMYVKMPWLPIWPRR